MLKRLSAAAPLVLFAIVGLVGYTRVEAPWNWVSLVVGLALGGIAVFTIFKSPTP